MPENNDQSRFPNLGKLSIAILEHLVEPVIGEKAIETIKTPNEQRELKESIQKALEKTEERFNTEYTDKAVQEAIHALPLSNLPSMVRAVQDFFARPTDPALANIIIEQLRINFNNLPEEQIKYGTFAYLRILREELVSLSSEIREKLSTIASLQIQNDTQRIANTLDNIFEHIAKGDKAEKPYLQPKFLSEPLPVEINTDKITIACQTALTELLALQYPWGEWSDRRTKLESIIAEREPHRGPEGPKPNVARTLFALDVLDLLNNGHTQSQRDSALAWITKDISDGWYLEWSSSQSLDSESILPHLIKRKDVRHTAQIVTAYIRWKNSREPLASLLKSIAESCLPVSGFWSESPNQTEPRLLASVYALEALGYAVAGKFRLSLEDLLDEHGASNTRTALRRGLTAFHKDADSGNGLLGFSFSKPTPYLTGIGLFRIASLGRINQDFQELVEKIITGLSSTIEKDGWVDYSVTQNSRELTRKRTTLRVAAGMGLAHRAGFTIPNEVKKVVIEKAQEFVLDEDNNDLDSPDFACVLLCLFSFYDQVKGSLNWDEIESNVSKKRVENSEVWRDNFEKYLARLELGLRFGLPDYEELSKVFEERIRLLK